MSASVGSGETTGGGARPDNYNLEEPAVAENWRNVQGQDGVPGDRDHLDPADAGAEAKNIPVSLDVSAISRKVDDDEKQ